IGDADDGLLQQRTRVAHGLRERTPQVEREIAVAVVGETMLEPVFAHSLYLAGPRLLAHHRGNAEQFIAIPTNLLTLPRQLSPRQVPWKASNLGAFHKGQPAEARERSMNYEAYFAHALARLRDERRYRVFADLERLAGRFPHATWHSP